MVESTRKKKKISAGGKEKKRALGGIREAYLRVPAFFLFIERCKLLSKYPTIDNLNEA